MFNFVIPVPSEHNDNRLINPWCVLAGGVNLYKNGRVDSVFEKVRPRSLVGEGTSVYMYGGELGSVRGSSLRLVSTPFAGGVLCSLRSWRVWMRVYSRGVQCCGWVIALRMRCDHYGHGLESPHIRMYLECFLAPCAVPRIV